MYRRWCRRAGNTRNGTADDLEAPRGNSTASARKSSGSRRRTRAAFYADFWNAVRAEVVRLHDGAGLDKPRRRRAGKRPDCPAKRGDQRGQVFFSTGQLAEFIFMDVQAPSTPRTTSRADHPGQACRSGVARLVELSSLVGTATKSRHLRALREQGGGGEALPAAARPASRRGALPHRITRAVRLRTRDRFPAPPLARSVQPSNPALSRFDARRGAGSSAVRRRPDCVACASRRVPLGRPSM
jgi:hypothetical protein